MRRVSRLVSLDSVVFLQSIDENTGEVAVMGYAS